MIEGITKQELLLIYTHTLPSPKTLPPAGLLGMISYPVLLHGTGR